MKFQDYPKFFGAIAKLFIEDGEFYQTFIKHNFDPCLWPECEAKKIAVDFHNKAQSKSVEYARLHLRDVAKKIQDYPISETQNDLIVEFEQYKTFGIWHQTGQEILKNPFKATEIISHAQNKNIKSIEAIMVQEYLDSFVQNHIKKLKNKTEVVRHIPRWPVLSESIGGFNPGRVFLFVAGTGVGKTTLTLNMAVDAIKSMSVLFINMEMIVDDVMDRIVQLGSCVTSKQWKREYSQDLEPKIGACYSKLYESNPFFITDGRSLTIDQIKNLIFRYKDERNIQLVIIDYDQKIRNNYRGEEWQAIQKAVEEIEDVAKATKTAVIILAQGDENNDPKASKRSKQSASAVVALYKDDVDGNEKYFLESKKNRFGPKFKIELNYDFDFYKMSEIGLAKNNKDFNQKNYSGLR